MGGVQTVAFVVIVPRIVEKGAGRKEFVQPALSSRIKGKGIEELKQDIKLEED